MPLQIFSTVINLGFIPFLCLTGVLGNTFLLVTISKNNVLGHTYYNFLSAIAALDIASNLLTVPITVSRCAICDFEHAHITGLFAVFIMVGIQKIFIVSSCWTVLFLVFDLCLHTFHRKRKSFLSKLRVSSPWLLIFLISMISIVETLPTFWYYRLDQKNRLTSRVDQETVFYIYNWVDITLTGIFYLTILSALNLFLIWRYKYGIRNTDAALNTNDLFTCCGTANVVRPSSITNSPLHHQHLNLKQQLQQHRQRCNKSKTGLQKCQGQPKQKCCVIQQQCSYGNDSQTSSGTNNIQPSTSRDNQESCLKIQASTYESDPQSQPSTSTFNPTTSKNSFNINSTPSIFNPQPATSNNVHPPSSNTYNPHNSITPYNNNQFTVNIDDPKPSTSTNDRPQQKLPTQNPEQQPKTTIHIQTLFHPSNEENTQQTNHNTWPRRGSLSTPYVSPIQNLAINTLTLIDFNKDFYDNQTLTGTGTDDKNPNINTPKNQTSSTMDDPETRSNATNISAVTFNPTKLHMYYSKEHFHTAVQTVSLMTIVKFFTLGPGTVLQSIVIRDSAEPETLSLFQSMTTLLLVICNLANVLTNLVLNNSLKKAYKATLGRYFRCHQKVHPGDTSVTMTRSPDHQQASAANSLVSYTPNSAAVIPYAYHRHHHNIHDHHSTTTTTTAATAATATTATDDDITEGVDRQRSLTGLASPRDTIQFFRDCVVTHMGSQENRQQHLLNLSPHCDV